MNFFPTAIFFLMMSVAWTNARDWHNGSAGKVLWGMHCDFNGNDISNQQSSGEDCGDLCVANPSCTHFTWFNDVCYLKSTTRYFPDKNSQTAVCGWVVNRPTGITIINNNNNNNNNNVGRR